MISLLICTGLLLAAADEPAADEALATQVNTLVGKLDAPQLTERDAAERELHALGLRALPLLPATDGGTPAEVALRVNRVRQQLLREQALAAASPSLVTLQGQKMSLARVLEEISSQTGNRIADHREAFGQRADDHLLDVNFDQTPFWRALDTVLDKADLTLYGFAGERGAFIVNRAAGAEPRAAHACYAGVFRLEPLRFEAQRDLQDEDQGALRLVMEVSWEPRLQPFAISQPLADVDAVGDAGQRILPLSQMAQPETLIRQGFSTTELLLPFKLPPRSIEKIATLKGKLLALVPGPLADFRFDALPLAQGPILPKPIEKRQGKTVVTLDQVRRNADVWEARVRVRVEAPAAAMESHRGWILDNRAAFEDGQGNRIEPGGMEQTRHTEDEIGISYLFHLPDGPQDLTFVYSTPLVILELPVAYEFQNLSLP